MNTTDDKKALIPEGIVYKLFDQSNKGNEANALAIKELANAVGNLANTITTPPMNKDVLDVIGKHDNDVKDIHKTTIDVLQNHDQKEETRIGGIYDNLKDGATEDDCEKIETHLTNIDAKLLTLSSRVITMIMIVLIAFSLMTVSYLFVRHGINQTVQDCVTQQLGEMPKVTK